MKKFVKVMLIIAFVFVIFGIGLSIGGVAMGASADGDVIGGIRRNVKQAASFVKVHGMWDFDWDDDDWDDDDWDDDDWDYDGDWDDDEVDLDHHDEDHITAHTASSSGGREYSLDTVREIEIDLHYDELIMQAYDGNVMKLEVENDSSENVRVKSDSGKLKIESRKKLKNRKVILSYPENAEFSKVEINIAAGSGTLQGDLRTEKLDICIGAGAFDNKGKIACEKAELEVGVGSLEISGLTASEISGECGIGELDLGIGGSEADYNYELECGIGEINVGTESYSGLANEKKITNPSASRRMELECGMGEINVKFED